MNSRKRMLEGLEEDIRFHIESETLDNIDRGMAPEEAHRAALLKFGNVARVVEDTREVWGMPWIERRLQDVRFGFRMLLKHPSFAIAAVLSLELGIGSWTLADLQVQIHLRWRFEQVGVMVNQGPRFMVIGLANGDRADL